MRQDVGRVQEIAVLAGERPETVVLKTTSVPVLVKEPVRKILRQVRRRDREELPDFWFGHGMPPYS